MQRTIVAALLVGVVSGQAPIRWLDLDGDAARQVIVRQVPGRYLGHPTTLLLPDGVTMLCVHPEGHGRGPIALQRSADAGRTWSGPLPVPESWATSKETPTIYRLVDPGDGSSRLVLFSGLFPIRSSVSTDANRFVVFICLQQLVWLLLACMPLPVVLSFCFMQTFV